MTSGTAARVATVRDLTRRFKSTVAVGGVSFDLSAGELLGVVGADGSGKTTLLQMLAAILDPTSGSCEILGFDSARQSSEVTARIGYMSQGFTLYERLSVAENLEFAATVRDVDRQTKLSRERRLLAMAGLEQFATRRAEHLSGGMKKKLALCANLIHEPKVLLLDEPGLGVDPLSRRELWTLLEDYRRAGAAIVLTTSYMDEAERCDRLLYLHEGRVLASGTPDALKARLSGRIFEIETAEPARVEQRLAASDAVRAQVRLPGKIRFQLQKDDRTMAPVLEAGAAHAVEPRLEDIFAAEAPPQKLAASVIAPLGAAALRVAGDSATVLVRNATCRFGDFVAVDDVSLELGSGEVLGLLGSNGAGKTTLIRMLCGLQRFQSGAITVAGLDVARDARALRARIGYMSQRFSLYPDLTVTENLHFFSGVYGLDPRKRATAVDWAVSVAGLEGVGERPVREISGAIRQRLALACSVMHWPRVLFLDEPTAGVDPSSRHRFWRLVHEFAARGVTVLLTTHYMEEAAYCERLGLMHQGRLIALASAAELRARERLPESYGIEDLFVHYIGRSRVAA